MEGGDFQIYELPYQKGQRPSLGDGRVSAFETPKTAMTSVDLRGEVVPLRERIHDRMHMGLPLPLRIRNRGTLTWPGVGVSREGLVGVVFRVRRAGESDYQRMDRFNRLPTDLGPGQEAIVWSMVFSPRSPGDYELVPCLAQAGFELIRCFEDSTIMLQVGESRSPPPPRQGEAQR